MLLTNEIVDGLISALKELTYNKKIIEFPSINEKLKLDAISVDKRYEFTIHINRVIVRPDKPDLKVSFLLIYKNEALMRIDIAGADHKNSKEAMNVYSELQEIVPCPHIHIFNSESSVAYPLNKYCKYDNISNVNDLIDIFIKFLELSNICNYKNYSIQPKL